MSVEVIRESAPALRPLALGPLPAEPLVSVLVSSYNYARYVGGAIQSVLDQTYQRFEVLVCDDGSADDSCRVIEEYARRDPRVTLIRKPNGGQASALNAAYRQARGDLIAYLDSDDAWYPERLARVVREFRRQPGVGLVSHLSDIVDGQGAVLGLDFPPMQACGWLLPQILAGKSPVTDQTWMSLRREVAELVFPLPDCFVDNTDAVIGARASLLTPVVGLPVSLGIWRKHGRNRSGGFMTVVGPSDEDLELLALRMRQAFADAVEFAQRTHGVAIGQPAVRAWARERIGRMQLWYCQQAGRRPTLDVILTLAGRRGRQWERLYAASPRLAGSAALWWWGSYGLLRSAIGRLAGGRPQPVARDPAVLPPEGPEPWPAGGLERVTACPICASERREPLYQAQADRIFGCAPGLWALHRCGECRSAYLDPRPTPATIGLAYGRYFTHALAPAVQGAAPTGRQLAKLKLRNGYVNARFGDHQTPASPLGRWILPLLALERAVLDRDARHLPRRPGRLLDLGCGNGEFLRRAAELGWEACGLDPDERAAAAARASGLDARQGYLEADTFPPESFDYITLSHVIEHVHDPVEVLKRCRRILKPGGAIWLATPDLDSFGHRRFGADWIGLDPPRHLVVFTVDSLRRACAAAGLACSARPGVPLDSPFLAGSLALSLGYRPFSVPGQLYGLLKWQAGLRDRWSLISGRGRDEMVLIARPAGEQAGFSLQL